MSDTKALRDLLAAATPGEWEARRAAFESGERELIVTFAPHNFVVAEIMSDETWTQDGTFIAAVHNALPALLDELDALRAYKAAHERVLAEVEELPKDFKDGHAWLGAMNEGEIELRDALRAAEAEGGE